MPTMTTSTTGPTLGNHDYPRGFDGLKVGLLEIAHRIRDGARNHDLIMVASQIIQEAQLPVPRGRIDPKRTVEALFKAQKRAIAFVRDPVNTERMASAAQLWCVRGERCVPAGDCDDQIIALGAMTAGLGIPVRVVTRLYKGQAQTHTTMQYMSGPRLGGPWVGIDPSTDAGTISSVPYLMEWIVEVDMGSETEPGVFVGMGDAPDAELYERDDPGGYPGTMGAGETTGGPYTGPLPDPVAQVWITELGKAGDAHLQSAALLVQNLAAYTAFRQANGLPQYDPDPTAASDVATMNANPLAYYAQTKQFTQAVATAEAKLMQTNQFMAGAVADALSGKRALYWDDGKSDLGIASAPGDPFYLVPQANAQGVVVPTFIDPTTALVSGTMGVWPVLAVLGVATLAVAMTLGALYLVEEITAHIAQMHHDDMVAKVSGDAAAMVASGKMSPDQAATYMKNAQALADSGIIPQGKPPGSSALDWMTTIGVAVGAAALGFVAAAFLAPKLAPHIERSRRAISSGVASYRNAA